MQVSQPEKQKACKHCYQVFAYKRVTAEFCSSACRVADKRARQEIAKLKRIYRAEESPFFKFLAESCIRAGTLEVLAGHTLESLLELHELYSLRLKGNYYSAGGNYQICHLFPVKHGTHIGLLHPSNLMVGLKKLNQQHQAKVFDGAGKSLLRAELLPCWKLSGSETVKFVVLKVIDYLGEELAQLLTKEAKLKPSQRHKVMMFLGDCNDPRIPDPATLDSMSTQQLTKLKEIIENKKGSFDIGFNARHISPEEMALLELRRLAKYRPELLRLEAVFTEVCEGVRGYHDRERDYYHVPQEFTLLQFEVLHGREVGALLEYWHSYNNPEPVAKPNQPIMVFESFDAELDYLFGSPAQNTEGA